MLEHRWAERVRKEWMQQGAILLGLVSLFWFLEIVDLLIWRGDLDVNGIHPRTWVGLRNILLAPFLHAGFRHLMSNTIPFVVLGWFVMLRRTRDFFVVSVVAGLISGLGIWLFGGPNTVHIGASGVLFGYLGFLLGRGYFERSVRSIIVAVIVGLFYGGMLWGLLPGQPGISWLGHLFGFVGGGAAAYLLAEKAEQ
jgi:membrane associated rhomboid family serine protease